MQDPLISIVLPTKNSLPHLKNAIQSIRQQTYRNFELVIQDGVSTDGTLEYLHTIIDLPNIEIASEPDSGLAQAYARGTARAKGELLCFIGSDEKLFDYSLKMGLSWFKEYPSAAVIYGGTVIVDKLGKELGRFIPEPFDFLRFMKCELFPSQGGLFNRKIIGTDMYYDQSLKTCPDYEFWLRIGSRFSNDQLINRQEIFMTALGDETSMSFRPSAFEQFCKDKSLILDRFLSGPGSSYAIEMLKKEADISSFIWAADGVLSNEGISPFALELCREAARIDSGSCKLKQLIDRWKIDL